MIIMTDPVYFWNSKMFRGLWETLCFQSYSATCYPCHTFINICQMFASKKMFLKRVLYDNFQYQRCLDKKGGTKIVRVRFWSHSIQWCITCKEKRGQNWGPSRALLWFTQPLLYIVQVPYKGWYFIIHTSNWLAASWIALLSDCKQCLGHQPAACSLYSRLQNQSELQLL